MLLAAGVGLLADVLSPHPDTTLWVALALSTALAGAGATTSPRWAGVVCPPAAFVVMMWRFLDLRCPWVAVSGAAAIGLGLVVGARRMLAIARDASAAAQAIEDLAVGLAVVTIVHNSATWTHHGAGLAGSALAVVVLAASAALDAADLVALRRAYRGRHALLELVSGASPREPMALAVRAGLASDRQTLPPAVYRRSAAPSVVARLPGRIEEPAVELATRSLVSAGVAIATLAAILAVRLW